MGKYCKECGTLLKPGAKFCHVCGKTLAQTPQPQEQPRQYAPQQYAPRSTHLMATAPRMKSRTGLFIAGGAAVLLVTALALVLFVWPGLYHKAGKEDAATAANGVAAGIVEMPKDSREIVRVSAALLLDELRAQDASGLWNMGAAFGIPQEMMDSPQAVVDARLTAEDQEDEMNYRQSSTVAEDGTAAYELTLSGSGETMASGAYFQGDDMFIRLQDATQPLLRYTLSDPQDVDAINALPPMERYLACLSEAHPKEQAGLAWEERMALAMDSLTATLAEEDVEQGTQERSILGQTHLVDTYTISLSGPAAGETMRGLLSAWESERAARRFLNMADNADAILEEDIVPGTTLENMAALAEDSAGQATMTFVVSLLEERPVGLALQFSLPEGSIALEMNLWQDEYEKENRISLRAPDGRGFDMQDLSQIGTGGVYDQELLQTLYLPGGAEGAINRMTAQSTYGDNSLSTTFQNEYLDMYSGKGTAIMAEGTYSHTVANGQLNGNASGKTSFPVDGETQTVLYDATVLLSDQPGVVRVPEFLEGSGVFAQNYTELTSLLMEDYEEFAEMSDAKKGLGANLLLMMGEM
ncbi:MAG: zinc ribbon domain-containing protein [Clostridia bacterium]|nr:zinc ribbon domain-containing protein [Clostridia bacterium]